MPAEKQIIVGGQAVIEGVLMRTPNAYAVAVRRLDGTIETRAERLRPPGERYPWLRWPIVRGSAVLVQSMQLCQRSGCALILSGANDRVRGIFEISRLTEVFRLVATVDEAAAPGT